MLPIQNYIQRPRLLLQVLVNRMQRVFLPIMSDRKYLKFLYLINMGENLDLNTPVTFNAKLQWLKLNYYDERFTIMVDKYAVKQYVANVIGEQYVIPTLGVWNSFDAINFDSLPREFVLKTTHGGGGNGVIICRDKAKFDYVAARRKFRKAMKSDIAYSYKEWPYKDVPKRILAEQLLSELDNEELFDYKFCCFNGEVRCVFVVSNRFQKDGIRVTFFDREWNRLPFERSHPAEQRKMTKPDNYEQMVHFAELLSKDIPFVRCDFYDVNGHVFFGEFTFFPGSGLETFQPCEWDVKLGEWLTLPKKNV